MKTYTSEEVLNLQSAAYQKGINEGYELRKREQPGAMWVKASVRLPGHDGQVHLKIDGLNKMGNFFTDCSETRLYVNGPEPYILKADKFEGVEWLREGEAGNEAVEFVNWLHLNAVKISWDTKELTNYWVYIDKGYTTAQLYELFKHQNTNQ